TFKNSLHYLSTFNSLCVFFCLIDELIKANEDGTYKTYKSTEEIKAMNNEEIQIIYSNMKNYLSDKRTHINY
ncbi:hypothetical protein, partial [Streptococcus pneumoniae]|uniref:hypothetical protein n=1 Tax=Streptococcus pneumoniae TaxID=1313 RepID=UPI00099B48ED